MTPGKAVTTRLKEGFVSVGSPRYAAEHAVIDPAVSEKIVSLEGEGKTVVVLLSNKAVKGLIALRDEPPFSFCSDHFSSNSDLSRDHRYYTIPMLHKPQ